MLDNNVIPLRRFMRGIGATRAKVQVKGKLVHQNEPIEEGDGLSRAVLVSVSDPVNALEVQQCGRGQGQRQCNGCNNFYSQRYYYAHVSGSVLEFLDREEGDERELREVREVISKNKKRL